MICGPYDKEKKKLFKILTTPNRLNFRIISNEGMITIDQANIDLKIDGFYEADKSIATLDTVKIGNLFAILQVAIKLGVDSISGTTFNLNSILAIYDLDFINLNESKLEPFDHYYRFAITPKYDL